MSKKALIIGAGSYGEVLSVYLIEAGYKIVGFIDDDHQKIGTSIHNIPVLGSFKDLVENKIKTPFEVVFCSIGDNKIRVKYLSELRKLNMEIPNFIHSSVQITTKTTLGKGVYIFPNCTLMPFTNLGDYTMVSIGTVITHHANIGKGVLISCGVTVGAFAKVENMAVLGVGSTIKSGAINIGRQSIVGAGSVVIRDVHEKSVVVGNPAKVIKIL